MLSPYDNTPFVRLHDQSSVIQQLPPSRQIFCPQCVVLTRKLRHDLLIVRSTFCFLKLNNTIYIFLYLSTPQQPSDAIVQPTTPIQECVEGNRFYLDDTDKLDSLR